MIREPGTGENRSSSTASQPGTTATILSLFGFLAIVFVFAAAGGAVTAPQIDGWYAGLAKPALTPVNWVFPIVWNFLFFLIGLAGWLVWRTAGGIDRAGAALSFFLAQLMLNFAWSVIFFGLHSPGGATIEILVLVATVMATVLAFWRISRIAALLMLPYLAWCVFATYLTVAIWLLNR